MMDTQVLQVTTLHKSVVAWSAKLLQFVAKQVELGDEVRRSRS